MAYVKIAEGTYPYEKDVLYVMNYIADLSKCKNLIYGGRNIIYYIFENPYNIAEQFLIIQNGKRFSRRLYHIVISLDYYNDCANLELASMIGNMVTDMYSDYQSVFVVHEDKKDYLHIHIIFNNCPVRSDKKKLSYYFNICDVSDRVEDMIIEYMDRNKLYF